MFRSFTTKNNPFIYSLIFRCYLSILISIVYMFTASLT